MHEMKRCVSRCDISPSITVILPQGKYLCSRVGHRTNLNKHHGDKGAVQVCLVEISQTEQC